MIDIRIRAALAVVEAGRILLVPHFHTDVGEVQWVIPGGRLEFGESLPLAAVREFTEETGLLAEVAGLLAVSEVLISERPYHSITITYLGRVTGGDLRAEADHPYGEKVPRWFSLEELRSLSYHPPAVVERALLNVQTPKT